MIEAMKKYTFLVFHEDYENFLNKLRDLGVVHIETQEGTVSDEALSGLNKIKRINNVIEEMETLGSDAPATPLITDGEELLQAIDDKHDTINKLNQQLAAIRKETEALMPWGDYDPVKMKGIREAGYGIQFFVTESKNWDEAWREEADFEVVNEEQGYLYLMALTPKDKPFSHPQAEEVVVKQPLGWYKQELARMEGSLSDAKADMETTAQYACPVLRAYANNLQNELDFNSVFSSADKQVEDRLYILNGWVPVAKEVEFGKAIDAEGVVYLTDKALPEDNMPVKLKNNAFARLFESIGELYTLPNHRELDLTPFFAPFYMLFFGFCLGDAGYGLLIVLGTLYGMVKVQPKYKPLMKLGFYLGLATTLMGVLGGTFFGIMFGQNADGSLKQSVEWLRKYQEYVLDTNNLMVLSLLLGYVQVLFGMVLKAVNKARLFGFKHSIAQIGWIIIVAVTIPVFGLKKQGMMEADMANMLMLVSGIIGGLPALFYNTPGKNIFLNFGTGLWDSYGMASGLLGDVLSYIRLFALGLSSGILGNVFNSLALQTSDGVGGGVIGVFFMVLILAFGHSLNLFMALLGSFVHPLRLTFVEFYKNAGFEGGGEKYRPFAAK